MTGNQGFALNRLGKPRRVAPWTSSKHRSPEWLSERRRSAERFFRGRITLGNPGGCWLWTGPILRNGYGYTSNVLAHRQAYELWVGPIPDGLGVLHRCDVRACVNPTHLYPGNQARNMADARERNRTRCGVRHRSSKLTEAAVRDIQATKNREVTLEFLAEKYGVSIATISRVRRREAWRHTLASEESR